MYVRYCNGRLLLLCYEHMTFDVYVLYPWIIYDYYNVH